MWCTSSCSCTFAGAALLGSIPRVTGCSTGPTAPSVLSKTALDTQHQLVPASCRLPAQLRPPKPLPRRSNSSLQRAHGARAPSARAQGRTHCSAPCGQRQQTLACCLPQCRARRAAPPMGAVLRQVGSMPSHLMAEPASASSSTSRVYRKRCRWGSGLHPAAALAWM